MKVIKVVTVLLAALGVIIMVWYVYLMVSDYQFYN